jgi:hypothetical protein
MNLDFIRRLLKGSEFSEFLDYISPSALAVIRPSDALSIVQQLITSSRNKDMFRQQIDRLNVRFNSYGVRVESFQADDEVYDARALDRRFGEQVLKIYFSQLMNDDICLFDLRLSRFRKADALIRWNPSQFYYQWSPDFLKAVRSLYRGYYQGNLGEWQQGLKDLNLEPVEAYLRKHFDGAESSEVNFTLRHFRESFHDIFNACKVHHVTLHKDFIALGVCLAALYENLDQIDQALDVKTVFSDVVSAVPIL